LPALFLCLGATICIIMVAFDPKKYDTFKTGYDDSGKPLIKVLAENANSVKESDKEVV
jgi:hypothetical protein